MTQIAGIGNVTPNAGLVEMAMGYARSRALCAAARLGVADAMGDGERGTAELAVACKADAKALHRLLRALASIGIVHETAPGRFRLTDFGQPLRKDAPQSAWPAVVFWADLLADSWSLLPECIRTGLPAAKVRHPNCPSRWAQDPDASAIFRAVMGTAPAQDYMPLATCWDFSQAKVVADLGGGGGALLAALLQHYPHLQGVLVDREESIREAAPRFDTAAFSSRCSLIVADLTMAVPAGADVYMLKQVLHGYSGETAAIILKNCHAVIPKQGHLLIMEFVLPSAISRPDPLIEGRMMSDLNMLAVTGGQERSREEWDELLSSAGFELRQVIEPPAETAMEEYVSVIVATPKA